jgi:predicted RecB family nuclease
MQSIGGRVVYSATDLNNYLECAHLVALERGSVDGGTKRPEAGPQLSLIAQKGVLHEQRYLEAMRAQHETIVEIVQTDWSLTGIEQAARDTIAAMEAGAPVIYQGTFFHDGFIGKADFLLRVERPSAKWSWSYEVLDTKLAMHEKPYFIVQLCHYSEHVERLQGSAPESMAVILGSDKRINFRVADFSAYYRHLKSSFLTNGATSDAYPLKCEHCAICDWADECEKQREADDHLSLVAWMRRDHIKALEAVGTTRLAELAQPSTQRPFGMQEATFGRLQHQAELQLRGRTSGGHHYDLMEHKQTEGFGILPAPSPGDAFFDMEGDPLFEIGRGLEYLFGVYCPDDEPAFRAFWGTDRAAEKKAFEDLVDFLVARRKRYPAMHVYHYAPYEKTALRKLSLQHRTREDEVDDLLRGEVLVDLYAVVRPSIMISQPSYSIKKFEAFYAMQRAADVRRGDDSIINFEMWLREPERTEILRDIELYNKEDCESTWHLREWLLGRRIESHAQFGVTVPFREVKDPNTRCHAEPLEDCKTCARRLSDEREAAKLSADERRLLADERDPTGVLLGSLLSYHRHEEKPAWWDLFDRYNNIDALLEYDDASIGGLRLREDIPPFKLALKDRSFVYTYEFPEQRHDLSGKPRDPHTRKEAGQIISINDDEGLLCLKRGGTREEAALITALVPDGPILSQAQKASLGMIAAAYLDGTLATRHPVALDLLRGSRPRLRGGAPGAEIQPAVVSVDAVYAAVAALDRSYLFVQGPPGTGKTYTGARVIAQLLAEGKTVGVMANGHKAVHNLLHEVEKVALECGIGHRLRGFHKSSKENADSFYPSRLTIPLVVSIDDNDAAETGAYTLISGTRWLFSRPGMIDRLDYLFVDEAGQTSLADAIAVAPCAQNIVLLGDPMQLAQVSQGLHPDGVGVSILEHLLKDASTVPKDRGILLDVSFRMQPDICAFISHAMYDGRLVSAPDTTTNAVRSPGLTGSGVRYHAIEHSGNSRESIEEADWIVEQVGLLLTGTYVRKEMSEAPITMRDVLIVTPYNAQRKKITALLQAAGYGDVQVGTVDKFQGQEAPVVFYSMATSSGEDLVRNMEFLFAKNRFNVAISRAQCLSVLVCSPRLLDIRCHRAEQIALVNLVCKYVEVCNALALESV